MNQIMGFLSAAFGQGPLDAFDIRLIWLIVAVVLALAAIALVVWRSVVGWKEKILEKQAKASLHAASVDDALQQDTDEACAEEQQES